MLSRNLLAPGLYQYLIIDVQACTTAGSIYEMYLDIVPNRVLDGTKDYKEVKEACSTVCFDP